MRINILQNKDDITEVSWNNGRNFCVNLHNLWKLNLIPNAIYLAQIILNILINIKTAYRPYINNIYCIIQIIVLKSGVKVTSYSSQTCLTNVELIIKSCLKLLSSNSRCFRSDNTFKAFLYMCNCYKPCLWNIPADNSHMATDQVIKEATKKKTSYFVPRTLSKAAIDVLVVWALHRLAGSVNIHYPPQRCSTVIFLTSFTRKKIGTSPPYSNLCRVMARCVISPALFAENSLLVFK
jgi:hypothetical protein